MAEKQARSQGEVWRFICPTRLLFRGNSHVNQDSSKRICNEAKGMTLVRRLLSVEVGEGHGAQGHAFRVRRASIGEAEYKPTFA